MTSVPSTTPGPLNPGSVVSAAIRLYRDRFKTYAALSVRACLWGLVPVYGWAKYGMTMGLMSRLAFQELINQPETSREGYRVVQPKLWSFLGAGLLNSLILIGANIAISIASAILGVLVGGALGLLLAAITDSSTGTAIGGGVGLIVQALVGLAAQLWVTARLFMPEVPLAVEPPVDAATSISRSWNLSKGSVVRIQFVVLATYLVILPVFLVAFALLGVFSVIFAQATVAGTEPSSLVILLFLAAFFAVLLAGGVLILPFLQTVKGVLYYDLRSRREGVDLKLTDSPVGDEFI